MLGRALLAILLLLALGAAPAGAAKRPHVPPGWLGMIADGPLSDGAVNMQNEFRRMAGSRVGTVRFAIYWNAAQPDGPAATSFADSDRYVAAAARNRLAILPVVLRAPAWARLHPELTNSPPSADGVEAYAAFLTQLIARYGPAGSFWAEHPQLPRRPIRQWQVWNEPDGVRDWSDQPGLPAYVGLLRRAHAAIKQADPGAKVVAAGLVGRSWEHLDALYKLGAAPWFDVAAIHPFTEQVHNVLRIIRRARTVMKRHGDGRTPMVLTELSWPSARGKTRSGYGFEMTERGQAQRVRASLLQIAARRRALRVASVYWSSWVSYDRSRDYSFDYAGLRKVSGGKVVSKPAYYAFRRVARELRR